jgi:hypothetical protein
MDLVRHLVLAVLAVHLLVPMDLVVPVVLSLMVPMDLADLVRQSRLVVLEDLVVHPMDQ